MEEDNLYNILIEAGADFVLPWYWYDENGNPVDLTDSTIEAQLRHFAEDPDFYEFVCTHNGLGGRISITLLNEITASIAWTSGVYDVFVTPAGGDRTRVLHGNANIVPNVTKPVDGTFLYMLGIASWNDLPAVGNTNRLYFVYDERKIYRWNGVNYIVTSVGNGIRNIRLKSHVDVYTDIYTIVYDDGTTWDYTVTTKGVYSVAKIGSTGTVATGVVDQYRMTFNDNTYFDYYVTNGRTFDVKGTHDSDLTYSYMDMVRSSGATYVAKQNVPANIDISNTTYWQLVLAPFTLGTVTSVGYDADPEITVGGTPDAPVLNFKVPRGIPGNESIDDTKGDGDTDYVWSANKTEKTEKLSHNRTISYSIIDPTDVGQGTKTVRGITIKKNGNRFIVNGTADQSTVRMKLSNNLDGSASIKAEWQTESLPIQVGKYYSVAVTKLGGKIENNSGNVGVYCYGSASTNVLFSNNMATSADGELLTKNVTAYRAPVAATGDWCLICLYVSKLTKFTDYEFELNILDVSTQADIPDFHIDDAREDENNSWSASRLSKLNVNDVEENLEWDSGTISSSTGEDSSNSKRARTPDYIQAGNEYAWLLTISNGYQINYASYDSSETFQAVGEFVGYKNKLLFNVQKGWNYRFIIKTNNEATIDVEELPANVVTMHRVYYTDESLSLYGKSADAGTTGDYFEVSNGENLIFNTLRPSIDSDVLRPSMNGVQKIICSSGVLSLANHGLRVTASANATSPNLIFGNVGQNEGLYGLPTGQYYTLSFTAKCKATGAGNLNLYYVYHDSDETEVSQTVRVIAIPLEQAGTEITSYFSYTFFLPAGATGFYLRVRFNTAATSAVVSGVDFIECQNMMLQKGKAAIPWKPNTQDIINLRNKFFSIADEDMDVKIQQLARRTRISGSTFGTPPLVLLHFSDIHADQGCLQDIIYFRDYYNSYITDVIHTGDTVDNYATDGITFWNNVEGSEKILNCIGNHDTRVGSTWVSQTMAESYDMYFEPFIDSWNVTGEENKTYYYKDYATNNVRLIVLDSMHLGSDQLTWFVSTLASARTSGLHVIVASHVRPHWKYVQYQVPWDDAPIVGDYNGVDRSGYSTFPQNLPDSYTSAVNDFQTAGGYFVCWIVGHSHYKIFTKLELYPSQLVVGVANAGFRNANTNIWARIAGTKSEDDFNVLGIDTYSKVLRITKVGVNYDLFMRKVDTISYNYETSQLIYSN